MKRGLLLVLLVGIIGADAAEAGNRTRSRNGFFSMFRRSKCICTTTKNTEKSNAVETPALEAVVPTPDLVPEPKGTSEAEDAPVPPTEDITKAAPSGSPAPQVAVKPKTVVKPEAPKRVKEKPKKVDPEPTPKFQLTPSAPAETDEII